MSRVPINEYAILIAFRCIRTLERALPFRAIWILCWPVAAVQAARQLAFTTPTIRQFDRLPAALRPRLSRPRWVAYLWRERTRMNLARLMCLWPDRFGLERWTDHCRCVGMERLELEHARGRPVVLALLHFGPSVLLCHWLRARTPCGGAQADACRRAPPPLEIHRPPERPRPLLGWTHRLRPLRAPAGVRVPASGANPRDHGRRPACPASSPDWRRLHV